MLDRLPVELLQHILRLAAPLEYTPDKYKKRRELLRNCCLVDRRTKEVAQPMLPEVFVVNSETSVQQLKGSVAGTPRGTAVKLLAVVLGSSVKAVATSAFPTLFRLTPAVVDLRVKNGDVFDLGLTHLKRVAVFDPSCPPLLNQPLPSLVQLTLACMDVTADDVASFTPSNLPNLRALSLSNSEDTLPCPSHELLPQLEVYNTDLHESTTGELSSLLDNGFDAGVVLLDTNIQRFVDHFGRLANLVLSCRLLVPNFDEKVLTGETDPTPHFDVDNKLFNAAKEIRTSPKPLRLKFLILPIVLLPAKVQHFATARELESLLAACEAKGIEVIWEEQPDWSCEHWISAGLWKRLGRARIESNKADAAQ